MFLKSRFSCPDIFYNRFKTYNIVKNVRSFKTFLFILKLAKKKNTFFITFLL
jgi:hypothetical protein